MKEISGANWQEGRIWPHPIFGKKSWSYHPATSLLYSGEKTDTEETSMSPLLSDLWVQSQASLSSASRIEMLKLGGRAIAQWVPWIPRILVKLDKLGHVWNSSVPMVRYETETEFPEARLAYAAANKEIWLKVKEEGENWHSELSSDLHRCTTYTRAPTHTHKWLQTILKSKPNAAV